MIRPDIVIYHANCLDGFGAAYVIWNKFRDDGNKLITFIPAQYGDALPDIDGQNVAIVDFSYKREEMKRIAASAQSVLVLDHHQSAEQELRGLAAECTNCEVHFDMTRSGAIMAWDYYFDFPPLPLLRVIQDRDLWQKKIDDSDEITSALRTYPFDFELWDKFCHSSLANLAREGATLKRNLHSMIHVSKKAMHRIRIAGHDVPAVNASLILASDLGSELAIGEAFAVVYQDVVQDGVVKTVYSLRSAPDGFDVAEIARSFGGGGHKHAAGFTVPAPKRDV